METQIKKYGWITTVVLMIVADIVMFAIGNKTTGLTASNMKGAGGFAIFISLVGMLMVGIKVYKEWDAIKGDTIKLTALFFGLVGTVMLLAAGSYLIDIVENPYSHIGEHVLATINGLTATALVAHVGSAGVYFYQNK